MTFRADQRIDCGRDHDVLHANPHVRARNCERILR
jgi:hypothetical protein